MEDDHTQSIARDEPTIPAVLQDADRPQDTEILEDRTHSPEIAPLADSVDQVPDSTSPPQIRRSTRNKRLNWRYRDNHAINWENYADYGNDSDIE